ncbi:MAG: ShlB/FhaC/HecB family hemolysin secretion/activation protein [Cytophagales bacterium]|nr:ShlB/FhaC/HecB family hemolysin secretion/activation protein [Rhizobacter sp.]
MSLVTPSHAQSGAVQPGRVERDTRPLPEPVRRDSVRIETPRFAEQVPAGAQDVRFLLGEVQVSGNTVLSTQALSAAWSPLVGKPITLAEAFGIAAAISARYRQAGFILSQAIIPPQDIRTVGVGVLRIQVIEGFVDKISFTGIAPDKLAAYMAPVQRERPLRLATLERSLLLVGELAGVTAQANIRASATPNASDLEIVASQKRTEFSLSAHNRSTPAQGSVRYEASAEVQGVIGSFDRHSLRWVTSANKQLNLLSYSADLPLGSNGLKLQLGASASRSEPETELAFSNIDTRSNNYSLGLAYPLLRSRQSNLSVRGGLNGYNNSADVAGSRASEDHIRALRIGLTGDYADAIGGISLLDLEWSKGLSGLGASKPGDPGVDSNPQFNKLSAYAARLQSLSGNWSALLAFTAQQSNDRLPTAEQLGLGGDTFLRAFDPSEVIGEKGSAGKLELRYDLGGARIASTLYVYGDAGSVKRRQTDGSYTSTSLSSAGVGVRVSGPYRTRGYLEVAKPGRKDVTSEGNRNARVFAGLGIDF